ncbi:MAG TPA: hypothetical protein VGJ60_10425 [Chloroflexota bacterium]|jgi:hypothetical protein
MLRIPLTAHAECVDGLCGDLTGLVIRADSRTLEYYVVRDTTPGHPIERLVPRAQVNPAAATTMRLDCTLAELGKMQPLSVQEVTSGGGSGVYGRAGGYSVADSERAPDGTGVLRQDQHVEATDGKVGKLTGVEIDDDARITDFYTRLDRHGSPEVLLPTSAVSYVDRTTVYLVLDKRQVQSSPVGQDAQQPSTAAPPAEQPSAKPWWRFWSR